MFISLNQIFRCSTNLKENDLYDSEGFCNYRYATSLNSINGSSANVSRPMFWYRDVNGICPALIFHSNPYQKDKEINPWRDVILPTEGIAYYNGDNRFPERSPGANPPNGSQSGNNKTESLLNLYKSHDIEDRLKAPPVLLFEQVKINEKIKGYRAFKGIGIITKTHIRQQYEEKTDRVFSNYLFELALLQLPYDGLNWSWIDDRRNEDLAIEDKIRNAPPSWRSWVKEGDACIDRVRQRILRYSISHPNQQREELKEGHINVLNTIINHYKPDRDELKFEALASLAAEEFFGENHYTRGWITPQSGDMGIDFIGRYNFHHPEIPPPPGTILGSTSLLVIGQAKCRFLVKEEMAKDIARVASRLQRGHLGIYITTGTFKESVQREVAIDEYPMILINGRQLADLVISYMTRTGKQIEEILLEQDKWCKENIRYIPAINILHDQIPF
jgi:hypothetical protein